MALRNIARQRKRSILLGGAIAFGVLIMTLVGSFTSGLINTANERFTELLGGHIYVSGEEVSESGRLIPVVREQQPLEAALAPVDDKIASKHFRSSAFGEMIFVSATATVSIDGVDWASEPSLAASLDIVDGDLSATREPTAVIMPRPLAEELGVQVGETVLVRLTGITGQQNVGEFTVGALTRDAGTFGLDTAYADKEYLNSLIGMAPDQYQQVTIGVKDTAQIEPVAAAIEASLSAQGKVATPAPDIFGEEGDHAGPAGDPPAMMGGGMNLGINIDLADRWDGTRFTVTTINDVMEPVMTIVNVLNQVALGLFVVLLLITMVGLLNTFRMILIERTREIGTIRAIGMQRRQVRNLFLLEALSLALGGALAGVVLAGIVGGIISLIPIGTETPLALFLDGNTFAFPVNPGNIAATLIILTVITLFSAYFPARRAARMRPADALRTSY